MLPQIALVMVALAWNGHAEKVYRFCLAIAVGALIAIAIWALVPSLGRQIALHPAAGCCGQAHACRSPTEYGKELVALLHDGPGYITPTDVRGLIAFPSYHGVLALIVTWYAWPVRWLRWPVLLTNAVVLICTPMQGGHHLVDVLAAFPVAALSILSASLGAKAQRRRETLRRGKQIAKDLR